MIVIFLLNGITSKEDDHEIKTLDSI